MEERREEEKTKCVKRSQGEDREVKGEGELEIKCRRQDRKKTFK